MNRTYRTPSFRTLLAITGLLIIASIAPKATAEQPSITSSGSGTLAKLEPVTASQLKARLKKDARNHKVTIVNVWATWCEPCLTEMPDLVRFAKNHSTEGVRLILVSANAQSEELDARKFLETAGVDFQSFILGEGPARFVASFHPKWNSTVPATFVYDSVGKRRLFWVGKSTSKELEDKIKPLLSGNAPRKPLKKDRS